MRKVLIVVLLGLLAANTAFAEKKPLVLPNWTHTLPLSQGAIMLLVEAVEQSPTVETLLKELEQTDLVVYVTDVMPRAADGPASYLAFLSFDASARYVLVRIDHWRAMSSRERIILLGHELQHALEVAAAPEVRDAGGLARLYRRIGREGKADRFETDAAQAMGNRVGRELSGGGDRKRAAAVAANPPRPDARSARPKVSPDATW